MDTKAPYSYRSVPDMPDFDDSGPIVFMDGECALCSRGARIISRLDRKQEFKICPVQSETGQAVLAHFGLDASDPDSWLYLCDGRAYVSLDAMIKAGQRLGGIGWIMSVLIVFPRPIQDWLYRRIARNRIRLFGRTDMCALPDPELRKRLLL